MRFFRLHHRTGPLHLASGHALQAKMPMLHCSVLLTGAERTFRFSMSDIVVLNSLLRCTIRVQSRVKIEIFARCRRGLFDGCSKMMQGMTRRSIIAPNAGGQTMQFWEECAAA
jgi:hypothetical protein